MQHKYKTLDKKLEKLKLTQTHNTSNYHSHEFYPGLLITQPLTSRKKNLTYSVKE
jgi:hypothetical protein